MLSISSCWKKKHKELQAGFFSDEWAGCNSFSRLLVNWNNQQRVHEVPKRFVNCPDFNVISLLSHVLIMSFYEEISYKTKHIWSSLSGVQLSPEWFRVVLVLHMAPDLTWTIPYYRWEYIICVLFVLCGLSVGGRARRNWCCSHSESSTGPETAPYKSALV